MGKFCLITLPNFILSLAAVCLHLLSEMKIFSLSFFVLTQTCVVGIEMEKASIHPADTFLSLSTLYLPYERDNLLPFRKINSFLPPSEIGDWYANFLLFSQKKWDRNSIFVKKSFFSKKMRERKLFYILYEEESPIKPRLARKLSEMKEERKSC